MADKNDWMWVEFPNNPEAIERDKETFVDLDGNTIHFTRNGAVTDEAYWAIDKMYRAMDRDYRRLNGLD